MEDAMQMVLTEGDAGEEQESAEEHSAQLHNVEEPEAGAASGQVGGQILCLLWFGGSR